MGLDRTKLTLQCPADNIPKKNNNELKIMRGDNSMLEFAAVDPHDTDIKVDLLQVASAKFTVKAPILQGQNNNGTVIIKLSTRPGEITIEGTAGLIFVELLPKDTLSLNPGQYYYDVQLTMKNGKIFTLVKDELQIDEDVTLEGTPAGQQYGPVMTPQGQYFKRTALNMVRVMLKDFKLSPKVQAFQDDELNVMLDISLADFNAQPMFTNFDWNSMQSIWLGIICRGAFIMGLFAQGLLEQGREFNITDNGISFQPPGLGAYMQSMASSVMAQYAKEKEDTKGNMKPSPAYLGTFRTYNLNPMLTRLRHLRERQIIPSIQSGLAVTN